MLHDLIGKLSPNQLPAMAALLDCSPEELEAAMAIKPGYRDHSVALNRISAIFRNEPQSDEPWPDGVDPSYVVEQASAIHAGLRAIWSRLPSQPAESRTVKIVVVVSGDEAQAMKDLRRLAAAGIHEVIVAVDLDDAETKAAEHHAECIMQIGWAPGLVRIGAEVTSVEEWAAR